MVDSEEIKEYVVRQLRKGFPIDRIKDTLLDAGHSKEIVMKAIEEGQRIVEPKEIEIPKKIPVKKSLIIALILIIVAGAAFITYKIRLEPEKLWFLKEELEEKPSLVKEKPGFVKEKPGFVKEKPGLVEDPIEICVIKFSKDNDLADCNEIANEFQRTGCKITKLIWNAELTKDAAFCDEAEKIYGGVDFSEQEKLGIEENDLDNCRTVIIKDIKSCIEILELQKEEDCSALLDLVSGKISLDDPIFDEIVSRHDATKDDVAYFLALNTNDASKCDLITEDSDLRTYCKLQLERDASKIRDLCKIY